MGIGCTEISQISIVGHIGRIMKPDNLEARTGECVFCTYAAITFLGSPYPQLPFNICIALVQTLHHEDRQTRISQVSIVGPIRFYMKPGILEAHNGECVFCTDAAITFLGSPYP